MKNALYNSSNIFWVQVFPIEDHSGFQLSTFFNIPVNPILPNNQNDITIRYNAISFTTENNISYSYQLEGADKDWISANKITQVTYSIVYDGVKSDHGSATWTKR